MGNSAKYNKILDALQELMGSRDVQTISVSDIAHTAGIGKGSIYYYFPSKDAIVESLVERNYKQPIETAKSLARQTDIPPFTRMAMIFQACRQSSSHFLGRNLSEGPHSIQEKAYIHQKYVSHMISELKPALTEIIRQAAERGELHFDNPSALAEIVLIVLTVKLDNTLVPSTLDEIEDMLQGLVSLLEKGTENPAGSLNFLRSL